MANASQTIPHSIDDEMRASYVAYAMSVIVGRAIPDARDGLKPVHRRVLYSMHEQGIRAGSAPKKSARVVGDVLGKYHPHGDASVYDALVRMAQDFAMRYPLIDGQGNFGSVDGDPAAAMRYTECRLSKISTDILADIDKETVDWRPNYDDAELEPSVLPSRIPNLLVNGSAGIAVGMATNIPPHNLREIVDATIRVIRFPEITIDELMANDDANGFLGVKGPDFPTRGFIYGTSGIRQAFLTGRGRVVMRARAEIEPMPGKNDREMIVVTEIPYQVNKAELLKKIAELVREKKIEGISDLRDESDRDGMRVVIELKRDAPGQIVLNQLYQQTQLQSTFGVNCLAIVHGQPQVLNLKSAIQIFISHRREVVTRRTRFDLRKAKEQRELVEGLGMATTEVDLVVRTIRESRDQDEARDRLMKLPLKGLEEFVRRAGRPENEITAAKARGDYFLSERQAKAILEMRLARLTGLEREKLAGEYGELSDLIAKLEAILGSEALLLDVIVDELKEVREKHGDDRRTEIVAAEGDISIEDLIANEPMAVTVTHGGYLKRVPLTEYRAQGRGGKGTRAAELREEDFVAQLFVANAHADLLFLSDKGKAYAKKVYEIPVASRASRGRHVNNMLAVDPQGERIAAIVPVEKFDEEHFLLTCTRGGTVKRTALSAYANMRSSGIIGVQIEDGDQLLAARIVDVKSEVLIGTAKGMSIRFQVEDVRPMGRDTRGVRGIDLREGDRVIGMDVIDDESKQVLAISANGYGKRTPLKDAEGNSTWRMQNRGGLGIIAMETSERNGELVALRVVSPDDQVMVITNGGQIIRTHVHQIREAGRNTQGVRIIRVSGDERVVDVERLAEPEEGEPAPLPELGESMPPPGDEGPGEDA
ncbi:DNA gyrase subunit A [Sandaracinus amylolyticus]|uniref:DNA gyrase subunit A n=1 Tax=Sandaracinus amylolyticus TaxID=927083 RepID=A0A0F6SFC1_9BACT|nr:DNA gyrase subunit A [Sandaracinus amylolyticus]AKF06684.1 DNA gyrase subunit A [Sandaracinus amylolyticus]